VDGPGGGQVKGGALEPFEGARDRYDISGDEVRAMRYSIHEHKHRFAAWAAGRAATVSGCRFSVEDAKTILERAKLRHLLLGPSELPDPRNIDAAHRKWRADVIAAAKSQQLPFTHGVAAKLINVYLKAGLVCGGHDGDPRVRALHPPIDSLLLAALYRKDVGRVRRQWGKARAVRWSKFTSDQYEDVIASIRSALGPNAPLWAIEEYWRGYQ